MKAPKIMINKINNTNIIAAPRPFPQ